MYRPALFVLVATALLVPFAACGSFGAADDDVADAAPSLDGGGTDGTTPDGASPDADGATSAPDAPPDGPEPIPVACNGTPAGCAAGLGCCVESGVNACVAATACDAYFVGCTRTADCGQGEACCFDTVEATATCVAAASCVGAKRRLCATAAECGANGMAACTAVGCKGAAGPTSPFLSACETAMATPVTRGGLTCTFP